MLQFEEIKEDDMNIKSIGDIEAPIPKSFILVFNDDELREEFVPELEEKLENHDFAIKDEYVNFMVHSDDLMGINKIEMDVSFFYFESKGKLNIPEIEMVEKTYRAIFEDFYRKNKPY